jgi:hypothetical protein
MQIQNPDINEMPLITEERNAENNAMYALPAQCKLTKENLHIRI